VNNRTFTLTEDNREKVMPIIGNYLRSLDLHEPKQLCINNKPKNKTLEQLGALFGVWVKHIVEQTGYSTSEVHENLKGMFLCRIYCQEPRQGVQQHWVDMLLHLQETNDIKGMHIHAKLISLKWSSVKQMRQYMDEIQQYYIGHGMPLPSIEKI